MSECIVFSQVYINSSNVDDYLVESISRPAQDPNAGEVYYRYMTMSMLILLCLMKRTLRALHRKA